MGLNQAKIKATFLNLFYFIKLGMGNELGHIIIVLEISLLQIGVPNSDLQLFTFSNFGQLGSSGDYFVSWLIDTIVSSIGNNHTTSNIFFISSTSKYRTCPWKFPHGSLIIWQSCLCKGGQVKERLYEMTSQYRFFRKA